MNDPFLVNDLSKLDVNQSDPFTKYKSTNNRITCFNSASWYHNAWINCCTEPNDWLCPIIFGCDETQVGSHLGRATCTPLHFTLSIFNEELRRKSTSWRTLGYLYNLSIHGTQMTKSMNENKKVKKLTVHQKNQRYHQMLRVILDSYIQTQTNGGIQNVLIHFGDFQKTVNIKVPCAMIIGDMLLKNPLFSNILINTLKGEVFAL